jgi:hypothetical protein
MRQNPKAVAWVEDDGDALEVAGGDWPGAAEKFYGMIAAEAACGANGEMEIEQGAWRSGAQEGALFALSQTPGLIWSAVGGADAMAGVVVGDEACQQSVGCLEVADFGVAQESAETILEMAETAFDFAFGLRIWGDAVVDTQAQESALELAARLDFGLGAGGAKETERIGINARRQTVALEGRAKVPEVSPRRIDRHEERPDEFAGVIVLGEDEGLALAPAPPLVNGAVVLPEFADLSALPTAAGPRLRGGGVEQRRIMSGDMASDGRA